MKRTVCLCLSLVLFLAACGGTTGPNATRTESRTVSTPPAGITPLRDLAQKRAIFIGAAVDYDALQNEPQYAYVLGSEFNILTPENMMKFDATEPEPNVFNFVPADAIVKFAQQHHMRVRGHTLVWYNALPTWITNGTFSRDQLIAILKQHIMTEVSHYRSSVNIWDVVNEAVADDGTLRQSIWERVIGPNYIDMAFSWAHEANPQAHLFYNDYAGEGLGTKSDAIYNLVKGMRQRGVPIYGVGLQMHVSTQYYPSTQDVITNMQRLAALGLKVQITEMDVKTQDDPNPPAQRLQDEAQIYHAEMSACLAVTACEAFVMWGFTDAHSWIPIFTNHADAPLPFDTNYQPKPAFFALEQALKEQ